MRLLQLDNGAQTFIVLPAARVRNPGNDSKKDESRRTVPTSSSSSSSSSGGSGGGSGRRRYGTQFREEVLEPGGIQAGRRGLDWLTRTVFGEEEEPPAEADEVIVAQASGPPTWALVGGGLGIVALTILLVRMNQA